jgi:AcrR family transcriptional regulator
MYEQSLKNPPDPEKQHRILDAATKVFAEQGFRNTDVEVIAAHAGVGKGTVYRYFGNKQDLFRATANWGMARLETSTFAAIEGIDDPAEVIRVGGRAYVQFFQEHPELVEILIQERAEFRGAIPDTHLVYREKNRMFSEGILENGVQRGVFRDIDIPETMNALSDMLYGIVVCGCLGGRRNTLCQTAEQGIGVFLNGLFADPESPTRETEE